jgi:isopentenyl diphosphate isomerase/L-lactate dehydrogenase-like FMN-dependent dehydrogenase
LGHEDARREAYRRLPRGIFEYIDGGAEDEVTLTRNLEAFRSLAFRPRMGVSVSSPVLETRVLGRILTFPVLVAPCGGMRLVHPEGDLGVARGAEQVGIVHIASSASGFSLEDIAAVSGEHWFQLYRFGYRETMELLVERAQTAGYGALVVTVDTVVPGYREKDFRNGFSYSMRVNARNAIKLAPQLLRRPQWLYGYWRDGMPFELPNTASMMGRGNALPVTEMGRGSLASHSPSWDEIAWIRENWKAPLVIKGILTTEDARRAADAGADGVVVSNHGGRQLDGAPATMAVLPEIVVAVGDELEILLDSGVRRGSDVVKALAMGAKAVLVGRLPVWGLATGGTDGVVRVLQLLRSEMVRTMRLMGCESVHDLDVSWLTEEVARPPANGARGADSALPPRRLPRW